MSRTIDMGCICIALKKDNKRCQYKKKKNSNYCGIHKNKNKISKELDTVNIIKIQSLIRRLLVRNNILNRGIAVYCRHLCNNEMDCFTFDSLDTIDNNSFISYKENDIYWGFDIETLEELINYNMDNPYSFKKIPINIINKLNKLNTKVIKKDNKEKEEVKNNIICKEYIELLCTETFQKMDNLNNYTKCEWFLDLSLRKLKLLYKELEDIWNYRLNLTDEQKYKYVSDGKLFQIPVKTIFDMTNKYALSKIILFEFNKMISEGQTHSDKTTASQWILGGLTLVNEDARNTLPWLYSSMMV